MKFVIAAVVMIVMAGIFHMMFIMFDYGFHDPDAGFVPKLSERINETVDSNTQSRMNNQSIMIREAFGYCRVICIGLCIVFFIAEAVTGRRSRVMQE